MKLNRIAIALCLVIVLPLAGCRSSRSSMAETKMKAPINAPANFLVLEGEKSRPAKPNEGCHSPLVDPKSGITLRLARSSSGHGDYVVPGGTYGVLADELLRVDCATGAPLGIVPR